MCGDGSLDTLFFGMAVPLLRVRIPGLTGFSRQRHPLFYGGAAKHLFFPPYFRVTQGPAKD